MLNSYVGKWVSECPEPGTTGQAPYLLNSHHNLNGVQAVQTEVIREVRRSVDLS